MLTVISLFDGISCGMQALKEMGIECEYYASEIDPYAIKIAKANHPEIIHIGDVTKLYYKDGILSTEYGDYNVGKIDLLIGGSPCQGFSNAGKGLNFDDPRSKLFFEFVRLKHEIKPNYFMLENVVPRKKEWEHTISEYMGVEPVRINSNKYSAQNRDRLYWCSGKIYNNDIYQDALKWSDVMVKNAPMKFFYTEKAYNWIQRHSERKGKALKIYGEAYPSRPKMQMLEASHHKKYSSQRFFGIVDWPLLSPFEEVSLPDIKHKAYKEMCAISPLRYITPIECERLQGLPDNYTACVSDTQRYKALGNAWNIPTVKNLIWNILKPF